MGYLQIICDHCRKHWDVYNRNMNEESARICPRCMRSVDEQTWNRFVLPAFGMMDDAGRELMKDSLNHSPLFRVDYRNR